MYKKIGVNVSFSLRSQVWFGRYAVFRRACFLPLECYFLDSGRITEGSVGFDLFSGFGETKRNKNTKK